MFGALVDVGRVALQRLFCQRRVTSRASALSPLGHSAAHLLQSFLASPSSPCQARMQAVTRQVFALASAERPTENAL